MIELLAEMATLSTGKSIKYAAAEDCFILSYPEPEDVGIDITGRYQDKEGNFTFHINQAGSHIECWMAEVLLATDPQRKRLWRWGGDFQTDNSFTIYPVTDPNDIRGRLYHDSNGSSLMFEFTPWEGEKGSSRLLLNNPHPVLSRRAMERLPQGNRIIKAYEWAPLTRQYYSWLQEALSPAEIEPLFENYFEKSSSRETVADQHDRNEAALELDRKIGRVFSTEPPEGWHKDDSFLVKHYGRQILSMNKWTYANVVTRSHLDWMQVILNRISSSRFGDSWGKLDNFQKYLDLKSIDSEDDAVAMQEYEADIAVTGVAGDVGIGLGGFTGGIVIEKKTPPKWKEDYLIWFVGASGGASVGFELGKYMHGTAKSHVNWHPPEIPGWITLLDASAKGSVGAGASIGDTIILVEGMGIHPTLTFSMSLLSGSAGFGAGAEAGVSWGRINAVSKGFAKTDLSDIIVNNDYTVEKNLQNQIHFEMDCSILTYAARAAIRNFCAIELASLMSVGSRIVIIGHADRLASPEYNQKLSEYRAKNTFQAIKDILGNKLKIKEEHQTILGKGEEEARISGDPDETPNPSWRKVEIILNSRLVLTLRGES